MVTGLQSWFRTVRGGMPGESDAGLRKVGVRLAVQTVALLLVMLVALEVVVFAITQQALLGSLESSLKTRAVQADPSICAGFHLNCDRSGNVRPRDGQGGPSERRFRSNLPRTLDVNSKPNSSDASAVYVDREIHVVHGDGALGSAVLDFESLEHALRTGHDQCCSVHTYGGQDYLVYAMPLRINGAIFGAVQTSISEHQYSGTMQTLLQALLVVAFLGILISGGISVILVRRALSPIRSAIQRQRDFVADAAHELRTPLAIMRTVGEVGMSEPSVDDLQATVAQMLGENQHLTRLVEDLSLLARTDTNTVAIERHPVDLSALVSETASELAPLAEAQGVTLEADVQSNIHGVGDILRLRQLLLILLDNALKHTPSGGIVRVHLASQSGRVRLQVTDSGSGIDPTDLPKIFDRFYRADKARSGEGSGLGLAIGKWIVEAHGGHIQAGNAPPRGAVFTVTVPLPRSAASA